MNISRSLLSNLLLMASKPPSTNTIHGPPSGKNNPNLRILIFGGDNMLGRAVQLTFPFQAKGEEEIRDSCTAAHYLHLSLDHPSSEGTESEIDLEAIRQMNCNKGSYHLGDSESLLITPSPDLKLLNLETAVTRSIANADVPYEKPIRYHMHSNNLDTAMDGYLAIGSTDPTIPMVVSLANNHVMDYGRQALEEETIPVVEQIQDTCLRFVGCGRNIGIATSPTVIPATEHRAPIEVYGFATECSGTTHSWWATATRSGVSGLPSLESHADVDAAMTLARQVFRNRPKIGIRIVSIHWGPNWAMRGESKGQLAARRDFAHRLIDECHVDLIYGHSSHHVRGMEVYGGKLVLYGAGDLINDYEGFENIGEDHYNRLGAMFVVDLSNENGSLHQVRMIPFFMNRLRLERYTLGSQIWRPQQRRLEHDPNKVEDLGRFVNKLSLAEAGDPDNAVVLHYCPHDDHIPGGPILKSRVYTD